VARLLAIYALVREIDNSTRRISELVSAIKEYSGALAHALGVKKGSKMRRWAIR
jgi:hypothetical protein